MGKGRQANTLIANHGKWPNRLKLRTRTNLRQSNGKQARKRDREIERETDIEPVAFALG